MSLSQAKKGKKQAGEKGGEREVSEEGKDEEVEDEEEKEDDANSAGGREEFYQSDLEKLKEIDRILGTEGPEEQEESDEDQT